MPPLSHRWGRGGFYGVKYVAVSIIVQ